ncbi:MAG: CYTH domain-containing protein [Firmicutes bacterium]|jgi:CYTH domain|nr:CYTH domain-containing protein [Bacillota bacterium]
MNEPKEMELKYLVDDNFDIISFVLYLVNNGFTMEDLNHVTNEDIYFDTPDRLLQRTDSSLRIRIINEKKIKGTLKYPVDNDSLYMQRIEIEKDLKSKTFDALLNAFNNEKFDLSKICPFPFLRLFNSRHDFTLKNGENIITLSFDIITYNEAIQELMVEIETKKTTNPKVLEDINELIKRKYDLKTTKQSKYQRGIELTKLAILTRKHL